MTVTQCSYSADGTNQIPLSNEQLPAVKENGAQDITKLVSRIIKVYFNYKDDSLYNLKLKRDVVTLDLDNGEHLELKLNGRNWVLINSAGTTVIDDAHQLNITRDVTETLVRIRNVATGSLPSAAASTPSAATTTASSGTAGHAGTNVNLYINGQPATSFGSSTAHTPALIAGNRQAEADRARISAPDRAHVDLRPESRKKKVAKFVARHAWNLAKGTAGLGWRGIKGLAKAAVSLADGAD